MPGFEYERDETSFWWAFRQDGLPAEGTRSVSRDGEAYERYAGQTEEK